MSIFGKIASAIFGKGWARNATAAGASKGSPTVSGAPAAGKPLTREELEAMIEKAAGAQREKFDWDKSIVDLMKVLKLDSSLTARRELARELGYTGKLNGSAQMNIWLHKQVMTKLAETGGVVPDTLKKASTPSDKRVAS